jgi:small subunit ribosomal protein S26e
MPISTAPYTRKYWHTKTRGKEATVRCESCGREVPKYKTFTITKGFRISDPLILQQVDRRMIHLMARKVRLCPSCARYRGISQPGKSIRKKHMGF